MPNETNGWLGTPESEPIRRSGLFAAVIVGLASFFGILAVADPLTYQSLFAAASVALGEVGILAFGVASVRQKVYSPATANEIMDADAVIAAAEREDRGV